MADPAKPLRVLALRGFQHVGAGGDHHSGTVGPSRRGLRSLALVPGAVFALCPEIPSLPGAARRSCRISGLCRATAGGAAFRRAAADPRAGISVCTGARAAGGPGRAGAAGLSKAIAPRTARPGSAACSISWACRSRRRESSHRAVELRDAIALSVRGQDLGRHRQPRHLVCAQ